MKRGMDADRLWGQWVHSHEEDEPSPGGFEPPEDRGSAHSLHANSTSGFGALSRRWVTSGRGAGR